VSLNLSKTLGERTAKRHNAFQLLGNNDENEYDSTLSRYCPPNRVEFHNLAADFFILPLIGRFWQHLQEEHIRELRTESRSKPHRLSGSGTILSSSTLSQFLRTLAILMDLAQNSATFRTSLVPAVLQLALVLGTNRDGDFGKVLLGAEVTVAAAQLALTSIIACIELDGGESLCMQHGTLIGNIETWSSRLIHHLDSGVHLTGAGGSAEITLRKITGILHLKVTQMIINWAIPSSNLLENVLKRPTDF
jgi:telomere length regulation protein